MNNLNDLREQKRQECFARGLSVARHGNAWRIHGSGVDFVIAELAHLQSGDLRPFYEATR